MTITHHLDAATLMSFAAGSLPSALAAVAAAHVAMCPHCRREVAMLERIGGTLISALAPAQLDHSQPAMPQTTRAASPTPVAAAAGEIPTPLAPLIGGSLDAVAWRWIGPGLRHRRLPLRGEGSLQLIKASPGASVPEHTHGGSEITLVLRGALSDSSGRYGPGDVADVDGDIEHTPVADPEAGCICVIATEAPTRFRGLIARLMQPWHGL
ncbi:MAG: ChrR family anti-sigma-E factor [Hyphomonadaceae bacterium]|jgi:putative transcriptional regulator|nr:ChrR family anti-sigma-E factor [Hyphomonadaceae bacterium]